MKKTYIFRIVSFFAVIFIFIININFESEQVSSIDNRQLMEISQIGDGDITINIEKYLTDRIGFRTNIINLYTKGMDRLLGEMIHPNYQNGKEGYIFPKASKEVYNGEFQEVFSDFILSLQNYCKERGIDFLYTLEPTKSVVYREYLPAGYNLERRNTEYLLSLLEEKNINYLDNTVVLERAKEAGIQVFDKKYDANHWNHTGAVIGISEILNRLNQMDGRVSLFDISKFEMENHKNTSLPVSYFEIDEDTAQFNLIEDNIENVEYDKDSIEISSKYKNFQWYRNPDNTDAPKILVFAGSYFNSKDKYMTQSFSEYVKVHNYHNVINYDYYIEMFDPDIVLFESTEYTHTSNYFPVEAMKDVIK